MAGIEGNTAASNDNKRFMYLHGEMKEHEKYKGTFVGITRKVSSKYPGGITLGTITTAMGPNAGEVIDSIFKPEPQPASADKVYE